MQPPSSHIPEKELCIVSVLKYQQFWAYNHTYIKDRHMDTTYLQLQQLFLDQAADTGICFLLRVQTWKGWPCPKRHPSASWPVECLSWHLLRPRPIQRSGYKHQNRKLVPQSHWEQSACIQKKKQQQHKMQSSQISQSPTWCRSGGVSTGGIPFCSGLALLVKVSPAAE